MKKAMNLVMLAVLAALILPVNVFGVAVAKPKNVILMISDGQGFNTVKATDYYTGTLAAYEGADFVKFAMQTNSAGASGGYVGAPYNPSSMATNFNYSKTGATDSASAATAMYTGVKNYDNQINMTTSGQALTTFFEEASLRGKATGAISTVNFDHATPATVVANTTNRNDYTTITSQMINSNLDVIMGAGHPAYNNNGQPVAANYSIVGNQANWNAITGGANGRTFIETKADFKALADGTLNASKVFGIAQTRDTVQEYRSTTDMGSLNTNVPTLVDMTKGTLNVLSQNTNGFAVMIEGGAIDWANHANRLGHMIEEQIDFNNSVQAVIDWVNANSSWEETLLIVTADHETGHLWGASGSYAPIGNNGAGNLPTAVYNSTGHTNALIPFFAKGANANLFANYVVGTDNNLSNLYNLDGNIWNGQYIDNTSIYNVAMTIVPEPATLVMLALGSLSLIRRKK